MRHTGHSLDRVGFKGEHVRDLADIASEEILTVYAGGDVFRATPSDRALYIMHEGMVVSLLIWREWEVEDCTWLGLAWTMPNFRGQGLYRSLVTALTAKTKQLGRSQIYCAVLTNNKRSMATHQSVGMQTATFQLKV